MTRIRLAIPAATVPVLLIFDVDRAAGLGAEFCDWSLYDALGGCVHTAADLLSMAIALAFAVVIPGGLAALFLGLAGGDVGREIRTWLVAGTMSAILVPLVGLALVAANASVAPTALLCEAPVAALPHCGVRGGPWLVLLAGLLTAAALVPLPRRRIGRIPSGMTRMHDLSDHAFLPDRFHGRSRGVTARG